MKKAACILLLNESKTACLCISRKGNLLNMGLPGGNVDGEETFLEAAIREFEEETDISIEDLGLHSFKDVFTSNDDTGYKVKTFLVVDYQDEIYDKLKEKSKDGGYINSEGSLVDWRNIESLLNTEHSFQDYNKALFTHLGLI